VRRSSSRRGKGFSTARVVAASLTPALSALVKSSRPMHSSTPTSASTGAVRRIAARQP
jgi:hypothetical protein